MDQFRQEDFDRIQNYAGLPDELSKRNELKKSYEKLEFLCKKIAKQGFEYSIRKDPRKQAGRGQFKFQDYQWAQIYPKGFKNSCYKKFGYIVGLSDGLHFHMMGISEFQNLPPSTNSSSQSWTEIDWSNTDYDGITNEFIRFDKKYRPLFYRTGALLGIDECIKKLKQMENEKLITLIKEKKQVVFQGPPGTGKTRLAKQIAKQLVGYNESSYNISDLKEHLKVGMTIPNASGVKDYYTIAEVKDVSVVLTSDRATQKWEPFYPSILKKLAELEQGITPENKKSLHPYELAVAKYLFSIGTVKNNKNEQIELLQFHPSYTYEDFVRGIEAKGSEIGIEYLTVNKTLAKLAKKAHENWVDHHSNPEDVLRKEWIQNKLSEYLNKFAEELAESENNKIMLTDSIYVFQVEEDCLRYKGDGWTTPARINFKELTDIIEYNLDNPEEIDIPKSISNHAYYRKSYYGSVLRKFFEFAGAYTSEGESDVPLKNFVLIIDEINRANLPSVLGELIYALEYRGEAVNSMYELNGDSKIILPKNLFIIGTMNTADRSVSHIDYAIRRRFAFIDVLPTDEPIETKEGKALFKEVSELFIKKEGGRQQSSEHLSPDFNYKDVQLGHSYFICEVEKLEFRLEYEIKPILREYFKDGILMSSAENLIESLSV